MDLKTGVVGLRELNRELRKIEPQIQKDLRSRTKQFMGDQVVSAARQRAARRYPNPAGGTFHLGSRAAGTIKPFATTRAAGIQMGSSRTPEVPGGEWGSTGKNPRGRMFPARQGVSPGFVLYPTVKERQDDLIEAYVEMLGDTLSEAFPE